MSATAAVGAGAAHPSHVGHIVTGSAFLVAALVVISLVERWQRPERQVRLDLVVVAGAFSAAVHVAVTPVHWRQAPVYGVFFLVAATAQLLYAGIVAVRPLRGLIALDVVGNLGLVLLWLQTRTIGVPLGPDAGLRERVGALDVTSVVLELVVVVAGLALLSRSPARMPRCVPSSTTPSAVH